MTFSKTGIAIRRGDLTSADAKLLSAARLVGMDIETGGLDLDKDEIHTVQLYAGTGPVLIVQVPVSTSAPPRLKAFLESGTLKVFHHAIFDMRFMLKKWGVRPREVACTKILSKVTNPDRTDHSLKALLHGRLEVVIRKGQEKSDWAADTLSAPQLEYASADVRWLPQLFEDLKREALNRQRWPLAEKCFAYLPTRVELDVLGIGDVYLY